MKTTLTKLEKLRAYKSMRKIIKDDRSFGFCCAYCIFIGKNFSLVRFWNYEKHLPELMKYKPKEQDTNSLSVFWFPPNKEGKQKRIEILTTIIKKLTNKKGEQ